jgi:hypothetical protein
MMPVEHQVCSHELAQRLAELGVRQESVFWWVDRVAYLALADNSPRPLSNCPDDMHQPVISPRIRFLGASCNPVD